MSGHEDLRIGLVGAGRMGGFHLETWEQIPGATVVALAEPDEARARARIGRRPIAWAADHRKLLERDDLDALCVCTPSELHATVTLDAIAAGLHVLVEKPIATTLEDGLRMAAAARRAGVKLMVGHVERFNPAVGRLAELIAQDRIGRVFRAHATRVGPLPVRIRDAGVAVDMAIHDLDIMQFVLDSDITTVYADGARFRHPTCEDFVTCLLRFGDGGPFGLLDVNWLTPEPRRELTVIGEHGMITASYVTQGVWITDPGGAGQRLALERVEPLLAELEAFAACIRDDTVEPVTAYDGCRTLIAALAVQDSAAHGRPVQLLDMPTPRRATVTAA
ncbi:MAG: putative dehydrogenase [Solirubrobacterales bacterium]|nr:putative dehydrogenase [Solirubrobacterales bacterium]